MTRREFLLGVTSSYVSFKIPVFQSQGRVVRAAAITDLHHGLAPDAEDRFAHFLQAAKKRSNLDFALQIGDFCHPGESSKALVKSWRGLDVPQLNVLGNHDMDKGTKQQIMDQWGMPKRFGAFTFGDFRFLVLDLNHFKKNGELTSYANGNYFTDNATHNWADPDQLAWLKSELKQGDKPTVIFSHQPLGMAEKGKPLPPEQEEIFDVILSAKQSNPKGAVAACICGHLHVDRLAYAHGIPCLCINSASYFWSDGMHPYKDPLYAFIEFDPKGEIRLMGRKSAFVKEPPKVDVVGMSASISDHRFGLGRKSR